MTRPRHTWFILDGRGQPTESSALAVMAWSQAHELRIAEDRVEGATVTTAFTCVDVSDGSADRPLLWETRIFGGRPEFRGRIVHSASREQALEAHEETLAWVRRRMAKHGNQG